MPSSLVVFRAASMLSCVAVAAQKLWPLWWLGPKALPHMRLSLFNLIMWLASNSTGLGVGEADAWVVAAPFAVCLHVLAIAAFTATFWRCSSDASRQRPKNITAMLALQIGLALLLDEVLLLLVAVQVAMVLPRRHAVAWLCVQMTLTCLVQMSAMQDLQGPGLLCNVSGPDTTPLPLDQRALQQWLNLSTSLAFQLIAFGVGFLGAAEARRRAGLAVVHAQLLATQELLSEDASTAERMRLALELHDAIGHHLMALSLHLDLARRRAAAAVPGSVLAALELTRQLLAEVRQVVDVERRPGRGQPLQTESG